MCQHGNRHQIPDSYPSVCRFDDSEGRGYSLEELAERSGLSFRGLVYIEHGQRSPSVLTLLDIAAGLDVEPGELVNHITREESGKSGLQ